MVMEYMAISPLTNVRFVNRFGLKHRPNSLNVNVGSGRQQSDDGGPDHVTSAQHEVTQTGNNRMYRTCTSLDAGCPLLTRQTPSPHLLTKYLTLQNCCSSPLPVHLVNISESLRLSYAQVLDTFKKCSSAQMKGFQCMPLLKRFSCLHDDQNILQPFSIFLQIYTLHCVTYVTDQKHLINK